jgi:acetyl-CoA synthetase
MSQNIESHLVENRVVKPTREFSKNARIKNMADYRRIYAASVKNPAKFWAGEAA